MTTCDILLSRIYSARVIIRPLSLTLHSFLCLSYISLFLLPHIARSFLRLPYFIRSILRNGLGLLPPFLLLTRKSRVSESSVRDIEGERREGTASEGSQRQLSKSCETGLDVYLLAQSAFISTRITRAVCYLPCRGTYGRECEKSVRKLSSPVHLVFRASHLVSSRAPAGRSRKIE